MPLLVPDVGEVELLKRVLYSNAGSENWTLKLYKTNVTPAEGDTAGSYTEADFTNYVAKTLTSSQSASTWAVPTTTSGTTSSTYGSSPQSWTCGTTGNTIYGYYVVGATSAVLLFAELFATARTLASGDVLNLTPKIELA
jgi:hypothetical protein